MRQQQQKQIKLANPSSKNIFYEALIVSAHNAANFSLPEGAEWPLPQRGKAQLAIDFTSTNLKPVNACLVLIGRKQSSIQADTILFNLKTSIDELTGKVSL